MIIMAIWNPFYEQADAFFLEKVAIITLHQLTYPLVLNARLF